MSQPVSNSPTPDRPGRRLPLLAGLGVVAAVIIGVVLWTQLRSDAPTEASLDAATAELGRGRGVGGCRER